MLESLCMNRMKYDLSVILSLNSDWSVRSQILISEKVREASPWNA